MRPLVFVYVALAVAGAATAVVYGVPYWLGPGAGLADFSTQAFINGPSATLSADLAVVYVLANLWILIEGRHRGMSHLWVYLVLNTFVAVAVGLGAFLAVRERTEGA